MKDGTGKCNIVPGQGAVHLAVFEILESERRLLDKCEGLGKGYNRLMVELQGFDECSTYVAASAATSESLQPVDWYKSMVMLGCVVHDFPRPYIRAISAIPAIEDQDVDRSRQQWRIVQQMERANAVAGDS
jgi:hypothetical protein